MTRLHHRAARYEVQHYQPHTLSWKPIAHATRADEAVAAMNAAAAKTDAGEWRVLDRQHGVKKARAVASVSRHAERRIAKVLPSKRG